MKILLFISGLIFASMASAQEEDQCFTGFAYHLESGEFAYTENHRFLGDSAWHTIFRDPSGDVIAEKRTDSSLHDFVPVFTLKIPADDYLSGIRHDEEGWRMVKIGDDGKEVKGFQIETPMAGDAGFHPFIQAHFDELKSGETIEFAFVAAGKLAVIDMKAFRIDDATFEGERALQFRIELDSWFANLFVDPLEVVYDPETKKLLEYRGIGNMHGPDGDAYPVRVSYYSEAPPEADYVSAQCTGGVP